MCFTPAFQCFQVTIPQFTLFNSFTMILFKFHIVPKILLTTQMPKVSASRYNSINPYFELTSRTSGWILCRSNLVWDSDSILIKKTLFKATVFKDFLPKGAPLTFKLYLLYVFMWALSNPNSHLTQQHFVDWYLFSISQNFLQLNSASRRYSFIHFLITQMFSRDF